MACKRLVRIGAALALLAAASTPALAQAPMHVHASLVATVKSVQPASSFTVALRLQHQPHWHSFWVNAGIGLPTRLDWHLPAGWKASAIHWPTPIVIHNKAGQISGHGYEGLAYLPVTLTAPRDARAGSYVTLAATAHWLTCNEVCVPEQQDVSLTLPVSGAPPAANAAVRAAIDRMSMPRPPTGWHMAASRTASMVTLHVRAPGPIRNLHFFPLQKFIAYRQPQTIASQGSRALLKIALDPTEAIPPGAHLRGVLAYTDAGGAYRGVKVDLPFVSSAVAAQLDAPAAGGMGAPGNHGVSGGLSASVLALALLGGLILNLMPCVFPVLGIKVMGFIEQAGKSRRKVAMHALSFTTGVVLSFWALAGALALLRASGHRLGWGFQLQSAPFVFALTVVMLVFALNLSGVFEFGTRATSIGSGLQTRRGVLGSFFAGVLAVVVATPCSAPFLAPALGAALAMPTAESFAVFTCIGLGLSAPYLLLSAFPALIRGLPRPGAWMETFRQAMAFLLYATVGYLVWILAGQASAHGLLNALFALALVAFALWLYGRLGRPGAGALRRRTALAAGLVLLVAGIAFGWPRPAPTGHLTWEAWSPERVSELHGQGRGIYVDFTARWCATCQLNEKVVFASDKVRAYFRSHHIAMLKADWTNSDPRITAALAKWGRSAVPFNLVYPPGDPSQAPVALPALLTPGIVLDAFRKPADTPR